MPTDRRKSAINRIVIAILVGTFIWLQLAYMPFEYLDAIDGVVKAFQGRNGQAGGRKSP